uniref:RRM domain-containing protein n=1 Tax=Odontella aurita TaxID=265563 RepID=A0A7S4N5S8_9STRA|mmetsp:Transcript_48266/g.145900  ORF Transcript_48266/g.145900 Transcript_48266/m.145900 type:complete len:193 (+) Transcript_48266:502-1080(+)
MFNHDWVLLCRWQDSGRLRGYGHVVFDEIASRSKALKELNGLNLGRRYLTVREPNAPRPGTTAAAAGGIAPRPQPEACRTVFVKNLPYESEEEDIVLAFRPCGKIVEGGVRLARNYTTKQCKGFAYVEFKNPEGAYAAVQKASKPFGMAVKGRPCFVDYDEGKMKGSYRTAEGKLWQSEHGSVHSTGGGRDQ